MHFKCVKEGAVHLPISLKIMGTNFLLPGSSGIWANGFADLACLCFKSPGGTGVTAKMFVTVRDADAYRTGFSNEIMCVLFSAAEILKIANVNCLASYPHTL